MFSYRRQNAKQQNSSFFSDLGLDPEIVAKVTLFLLLLGVQVPHSVSVTQTLISDESMLGLGFIEYLSYPVYPTVHYKEMH